MFTFSQIELKKKLKNFNAWKFNFLARFSTAFIKKLSTKIVEKILDELKSERWSHSRRRCSSWSSLNITKPLIVYNFIKVLELFRTVLAQNSPPFQKVMRAYYGEIRSAKGRHGKL